jgi:hypothetical protein
VQLLLAPFSGGLASLIAFGVSIGIAAVMVFIFLKAATTAEGRPSLLRRWMRMPNTKILFGLLFVGWGIAFAVTMLIVPHEGASSPYGGLALIFMFTGFFVMMGFLWAAIGD